MKTYIIKITDSTGMEHHHLVEDENDLQILKAVLNRVEKLASEKENGNNANTVLATGLYCIKVQANHNCWIADWDGDPGRTLVKENAKTFSSKSDAEKLCNEMKVKYPNRNVWVDVF